MKRGTLIASLLIHGVVGAVALRGQVQRKERHDPIEVVVVNAPAPAPAAAPAKASPPSPAAIKARSPSTRAPRARAPSSQAPPAPAPGAPTGQAPLVLGLTLDNADGPGIPVELPAGVGTAGGVGGAEAFGSGEEAPRQPRPNPCPEPPSGPQPLERSLEVAYTDQARLEGSEGRLVLRLTIDEEGRVTGVEVLSGVSQSLDAAAQAVVRTWRFRPATRCGRPVAGGTYTLARRFVLGD